MIHMVAFKVQQNSLMIHFQNQHNATLRGTELKPKLDRYLKRKYPNLNFTDKNSLDYKVVIVPEKEINIIEMNYNIPPYFGIMGESSSKYQSLNNGLINISFKSFDKDIIDSIKKQFNNFLFKTNFGTRQTKGFGSFSLAETDPHYKKPEDYLTYFESDVGSIFNDIDLFYKTIRGGLNLKNPAFYFKSMMYFYADQKGFKWEKKRIKEEFFGADSEHRESKLFKDLLGLSCSESWSKQKAVITKENKEIERYTSPILFKPVLHKEKVHIYIFSEDIPKKMLNAQFQIKNKRDSFSITTPQEFNITEYLKFAINHDLNKNCETQNSEKFKSIKRIYEELKANWKGDK